MADKPSIDDYLISAWIQTSPGFAEEKRKTGFPTGFWTDVARRAMQCFAEGRTQEELYALEAEAKLRYESDHEYAAHVDLEMPYKMPELGYGKPARMRGKDKAKNTAAISDLLGDLKL